MWQHDSINEAAQLLPLKEAAKFNISPSSIATLELR